MFPAKNGSSSTFVKISKSINWSVLFIECLVSDNCCLSFSNDWEDIRLAIVVSVGANTKVAFLWILVSKESSSKRQDRICGGSNYVLELVVEY